MHLATKAAVLNAVEAQLTEPTANIFRRHRAAWLQVDAADTAAYLVGVQTSVYSRLRLPAGFSFTKKEIAASHMVAYEIKLAAQAVDHTLFS